MKKLLFTLVIILGTITAHSQATDSTAKYQCLTISNIMNNKISEVWLDDGYRNRSVGVRDENGNLFKTNTQVLNYVCKKYNLELVTVTEEKDVFKFYLAKKED